MLPAAASMQRAAAARGAHESMLARISRGTMQCSRTTMVATQSAAGRKCSWAAVSHVMYVHVSMCPDAIPRYVYRAMYGIGIEPLRCLSWTDAVARVPGACLRGCWDGREHVQASVIRILCSRLV